MPSAKLRTPEILRNDVRDQPGRHGVSDRYAINCSAGIHDALNDGLSDGEDVADGYKLIIITHLGGPSY